MVALDGARVHRLVCAPRPPAEPDVVDSAPAQIFAALTAAHVELASAAPAVDAPTLLFAAWERAPGEAALRVLFGGRPSFPPGGPGPMSAPAPTGAPGHAVPLLYPPGSLAVEVDAAEGLDRWRTYPAWLRCAGQSDPLWTPGSDQGLRPVGRGGFDDYISHLADPFVWLVIAEPLSADALDRHLLSLETAIPGLRQRENSEAGRVTLERAEARYRELSRARGAGAWSVHLLVGGTSSVAARATAAVLCSASELDELPYVLAPTPDVGGLDDVLATECGERDGPRSPFTATSELVAALARPPRREPPGVRLVERADFDVTPEIDGELVLGEVVDDAGQAVGAFTVSTGTLNRHTFVAGATGSGKSQTIRHLLEQLHGITVPWLVIEPAKAEYAAMAGRIGADQVAVIHPGGPDAVPVGLNPLEPEVGFPLQTHLDLVRALFLAAFEADEPFPQVLSHALERCYRDLGWDTVVSAPRRNGRRPRYPRLGDLQRTALAVVDGIGYSKEISDNVRGFIDVRISSLRLGTPGRFFEGGYPLDVSDLMDRNVVVEIEDIGTDEDKAFFIGAVLIRIYEHLRVRQATATAKPTAPSSDSGSTSELRHVTVIEEAHRLLKRVEPGTPAAHAIELFTSLLAEVRAYGEGIVVAEQIPDKIVTDVVKNTALKILHRLPAADDRELVGATMNLDDRQSRHVVTLPPGRAAVFSDGMDRPILVAIPLGEDREWQPSAVGGGEPAVALAPSTAAATRKPLSLRELNQAAGLAEDVELVLWIELLTAAHIVGRRSPQPDAKWSEQLVVRARRSIVERALEQCVGAAIDARYIGLAEHYQPEELAEHLTAQALHLLDGGAPCDGTEVEWQAGRYRWIDVLWALRTDPVPADQVHPDTAAWSDRGLDLPGPTIADQLDQLRNHPDYWRPSPTTVTGTGSPPALVRALGQLAPAGHGQARLAQAAKFLDLAGRWPLVVFGLASEPPASAGQR